ncbi:MAG: ATP-dependent Clp protease adapter ClpS [Deltaproteobacteria bacterium]|nr:ATP-dependent Clp protease adapter ClpS [Deltaproteobacteria bacterium]
MPRYGEDARGAVLSSTRQEAKEPPLYKVMLHNDDYTTMDFVVHVLITVFRKSIDDAVRIMLAVHHEGIGVAGVYPAEIAETKIIAVHQLAREESFPLKCTMEPE